MGLFPCPSVALAVVMGSRYAYTETATQRGAAGQWLSISLLDHGHGSSLCNTDWRAKGGVLPHCELQPLAGVLVAKMQQDFILL